MLHFDDFRFTGPVKQFTGEIRDHEITLIWRCQHFELKFKMLIFSQVGCSVVCHLLL